MAQTKITPEQIAKVPAFSAYASAVISNGSPVNVFTEVVFNTKLFDDTTAYSTSTGRFTPQVAGTYEFFASVGVPSIGDQSTLHVAIVKNGDPSSVRSRVWSRTRQSGTGEAQGAIRASFKLNGTTDYVSVFVFNSSGTTGIEASPNTIFEGRLTTAD